VTDEEAREFVSKLLPPPAVKALERKAAQFHWSLSEFVKEELYGIAARQIATEVADKKLNEVFGPTECPECKGQQTYFCSDHYCGGHKCRKCGGTGKVDRSKVNLDGVV
jgi:hypothetical protein